MPRSTLPEFDPLAQLGIGGRPSPTAPEQEAAPRVARRAVASRPERVPAVSFTAPPAAPAASEPAVAEDAAVVAVQEMPVSQPETAAEAVKPQGRAKPQLSLAASSPAAPRVLKAKTNGRIPADLWEEVRDCVVHFGHRMTLDSFTEDAFRQHLKRLRKEHGLGDRFPAREHDPKSGRRVS
jgi:hypothetical protein